MVLSKLLISTALVLCSHTAVAHDHHGRTDDKNVVHEFIPPKLSFSASDYFASLNSNVVALDKDVDTGFKKEPDKQEKRIGIFCIGTGNYIQYLDQLIESIEKYFLTKYKKVYIISTDQVEKAEKTCNKYEVKHSIKFIHKNCILNICMWFYLSFSLLSLCITIKFQLFSVNI